MSRPRFRCPIISASLKTKAGLSLNWVLHKAERHTAATTISVSDSGSQPLLDVLPDSLLIEGPPPHHLETAHDRHPHPHAGCPAIGLLNARVRAIGPLQINPNPFSSCYFSIRACFLRAHFEPAKVSPGRESVCELVCALSTLGTTCLAAGGLIVPLVPVCRRRLRVLPRRVSLSVRCRGKDCMAP